MWKNADFVSTYSRAEAIEDGILMDVSNMASEAGFKIPVAVTEALWKGYIVPSEDAKKRSQGQSIEGRLWDVLSIAAMTAQRWQGDTMLFGVDFLMEKSIIDEITIKSVIGPGDAGEPVITLMLPNED